MLNYTTHLLTTGHSHRIPPRPSGSLTPGTGNTARKIRPVERVAVSLFLSFFLLFQLKRARTLCRRSAFPPHAVAGTLASPSSLKSPINASTPIIRHSADTPVPLGFVRTSHYLHLSPLLSKGKSRGSRASSARLSISHRRRNQNPPPAGNSCRTVDRKSLRFGSPAWRSVR